MASRWLFCVCTTLLVCCSTKAEELCTNQWDLAVEGSNTSELVIHHSSVSAPGRLTHLTWQWRGVKGEAPPAHVWVTRHIRRDQLEGGFTVESLALFPPAPRLWWALDGNGEGAELKVGGRGDPRPLAAYPPWQMAICEDRLTWGINSDKQLYVLYGDVNVNKSLEEVWNMELRVKRQAELPELPEGPPSNGTVTSWWRRLWKKLTESPDGTSRTWASDLAELAVKLFYATVRAFQGKPMENVPTEPDAEMIPSRFRAAQVISDDT